VSLSASGLPSATSATFKPASSRRDRARRSRS
jgi:hypothetical protein